MTQLLNTNQTFTSQNNDFTTFTATFSADGVANIEFSTGVTATGTWSEGVNENAFSLNFTTSSNESYNMAGAIQNMPGSGTAYIGWSAGVQISPFTIG